MNFIFEEKSEIVGNEIDNNKCGELESIIILDNIEQEIKKMKLIPPITKRMRSCVNLHLNLEKISYQSNNSCNFE